MKRSKHNRRAFLQTSVAALATAAPYFLTARTARAQQPQAKNDRLAAGVIGLGSRANAVLPAVLRHADLHALCDVDSKRLAEGNQKFTEGNADEYGDYRRVLERDDLDVIAILTPDHWHAKIAIEALRAGKDVYCEKPLTLTIDEGKQITRAVRETGRVFQVGTQQRSSPELFLKAVALVRAGRLGKIERVQCAIGGAPQSGPLPAMKPPAHLDWDRWLGPAPKADYHPRRCHYEFRWWYEYSGGKLTDWGAHHVDIATWALGQEQSGPQSIEVLSGEHPVPMIEGRPALANQYNTACKFSVRCRYADGVELLIRHDTDNGVLFEGTEGRLFVNRGKLTGTPVDALADDPLPKDALQKLAKGRSPGNGTEGHVADFFHCVRQRSEPISDVFSHHRALTTCHLANIALRLDRQLTWDPVAEQIVGDEQANSWLARPARAGYEIEPA